MTRSCSSLKKTATEVRSRPYSYKDTSQLDLDSVVIYTSGLSMSVSPMAAIHHFVQLFQRPHIAAVICLLLLLLLFFFGGGGR